jgi:hypothetical protein
VANFNAIVACRIFFIKLEYCHSQRPRGLRRGSTAACLLGLCVRIPPGGGPWMSVCFECCVLSGRGMCDELINPQRNPTECDVSECDRGSSIMRRPWGPLGAVAPW